MLSSRYDRQERIPNWSQEALKNARVVVLGAGALGNELIKNLALIGIGQLLIVDFDRVEISNLSRSALFRESDVGSSKAKVAAQAAIQLNSNIDARYIDGDLFYDLGLGFYRHSQLVVSCLDNLAARSEAGLNCMLSSTPFLDGGLWDQGGEVRWFIKSDGPCFDCTLSDENRSRISERYSCDGFLRDANLLERDILPTTVYNAAVIGGLLAQETVRYLCGAEVNDSKSLVYNGMNLTMHLSTLARDTNCPYHSPLRDVAEFTGMAEDTTPGDLLLDAESKIGKHAILELGRDFLLELSCENCHQDEEVNTLLNRFEESRIVCSRCGRERKTKIASRVDARARYAARTLRELGVPPGEVLAVRNGSQLCQYELSGDLNRFWETKV